MILPKSQQIQPSGQLLSFIADKDLIQATDKLMSAIMTAKNRVENDPYHNVIDPFSALVDAAYQKIYIEDWIIQEKARQIQKALQNALGDFHQDILGSMPGWKSMGRNGSYDIENAEMKIIAEIKNKYNTMNARSALSVYDNLQRHLDYSGGKATKAYLVEIIPKHPGAYEQPFTPGERGTPRPSRKDIIKIDGKSFYDLASGHTNALRKGYDALPSVLERLIGLPSTELTGSDYFDELFNRVYTTL